MSSLRRIQASRANGRYSLGPVTPEGKTRSSQNALKHGLLAQSIVLPGESEEGFDQLFDALIERLQPTDEIEFALIEEMAAANWRQRRTWTIENELLANSMNQQPEDGRPPKLRLALGFQRAATSVGFTLLQRYDSHFHNMFNRTLCQLLQLRKSGLIPTQTAEPEPEPAPKAAPVPAPEPPQIPVQLHTQAASPKLPNEPNPISGHRPEPRHPWRRRSNRPTPPSPTGPPAAAAGQ